MEGRSLASLVCALAACGGEPVEAVDPALASARPTWTADVAPMFARACSACHASGGLRAGGVELDSYLPARDARVKNACVSITRALVDAHAEALTPIGPNGAPAPKACDGWEIFSMPTGALPPLTPAEQLLLVRWVELGGPE